MCRHMSISKYRSVFKIIFVQTKITLVQSLFLFSVRAPGIEPGPNPWQGLVLPLNYARICAELLYIKMKNRKARGLSGCFFRFEYRFYLFNMIIYFINNGIFFLCF